MLLAGLTWAIARKQVPPGTRGPGRGVDVLVQGFWNLGQGNHSPFMTWTSRLRYRSPTLNGPCILGTMIAGP